MTDAAHKEKLIGSVSALLKDGRFYLSAIAMGLISMIPAATFASLLEDLAEARNLEGDARDYLSLAPYLILAIVSVLAAGMSVRGWDSLNGESDHSAETHSSSDEKPDSPPN